MNQQSSHPADAIPFGLIFRLIVALFCIVPSMFTRTITHQHIGEKLLWKYLAVGFFFWVFNIGILSGLVLHNWGENDPIGKYFHLHIWKYFNPTSCMIIDAETGILFLIVGVLCSGLHILDLWRRDVTHGTYVLSTKFGKPRLPVGHYEICFYWLLPSAFAFLFHLYGSAILFFAVFIMNLFTQIYVEGEWRFELLEKRDGYLLQESIDQNEIGLRSALNPE